MRARWGVGTSQAGGGAAPAFPWRGLPRGSSTSTSASTSGGSTAAACPSASRPAWEGMQAISCLSDMRPRKVRCMFQASNEAAERATAPATAPAAAPATAPATAPAVAIAQGALAFTRACGQEASLPAITGWAWHTALSCRQVSTTPRRSPSLPFDLPLLVPNRHQEERSIRAASPYLAPSPFPLYPLPVSHPNAAHVRSRSLLRQPQTGMQAEPC